MFFSCMGKKGTELVQRSMFNSSIDIDFKKIVVLYIDAMARDFKLLFKKRRSRCHASLLYHITIFFFAFFAQPNDFFCKYGTL
jgi:hypothetical protein